MIIVRLKGGLGNQMFQYALGRKLALKNSCELMLDLSALDTANSTGNIKRNFSLNQFNIISKIATQEEVKVLEQPYGFLSKAINTFKKKVLRQNHVIFEPYILSLTEPLFLDGYWQSPRYFSDIKETLVRDFTLSNDLPKQILYILNQVENSESVAVHVRRGDYAHNPRVKKEFGLCTNQYYENAIKILQERYKKTEFFIFSDEIEWVKNNFNLPGKVTYISSTQITDAVELYLMSRAKHNIIANSSFSWWSAWLNQNPNKTVVAPTPWFDYNIYDKDLIPNSWIQIAKN